MVVIKLDALATPNLDLRLEGNLKELQKEMLEIAIKSQEYVVLAKRRYHNVKGYGTYTSAIAQIACMIQTVKIGIDPTIDQIRTTHLHSCWLAYKEPLFPVYLIDEKLCKGLQKEELPINWEIEQQFTLALILLPKDFVKTPDGIDVTWLLIAHPQKGYKYPNIKTKIQNLVTWQAKKEMLIYSFDNESGLGTIYSSVVPLNSQEKLNKNIVNKEEKFLEFLDELVIKILLYMQRSPEEKGQEIQPKLISGFGKTATSKKTGVDIRQPIRVGREYTELQTPEPLDPSLIILKNATAAIEKKEESTEKPPSRQATTSHTSPIEHTRKGHKRKQRIGKGRREIKEIWIDEIKVCHSKD